MAEQLCLKIGSKTIETEEYKLMIDGVFQDGYAQTKGSLTSTSLSGGLLKITNGSGTTANEYWACSTDLKAIIEARLPDYEMYAVKIEAVYPATKSLRGFLKSSASATSWANYRLALGTTGVDYAIIYPWIPTSEISTMPMYIGTGGGDGSTMSIRNITIIGYNNVQLF